MKSGLFGVPETIAALKAKTVAYQNKLETAVTSGALIVENAASDKAPYLSGTLKRSIDHATVEKSMKVVAVAVGTDVDYARIHEFGGKTGRGHAVTIKARPYLRPALEENRDKVKREIVGALRELG